MSLKIVFMALYACVMLSFTQALLTPSNVQRHNGYLFGMSLSVTQSALVEDSRSVSFVSTTALSSSRRDMVRASAVIASGPAVLDRPTTIEKEKVEKPVKQRKGVGHEAWEVRIYNDGLNTREHVARSLVQVTGISEMGAYETMMQAHQTGIAVVGRWVYEIAEMYHEALRKNGIVCDIVPVEEES